MAPPPLKPQRQSGLTTPATPASQPVNALLRLIAHRIAQQHLRRACPASAQQHPPVPKTQGGGCNMRQ